MKKEVMFIYRIGFRDLALRKSITEGKEFRLY